MGLNAILCIFFFFISHTFILIPRLQSLWILQVDFQQQFQSWGAEKEGELACGAKVPSSQTSSLKRVRVRACVCVCGRAGSQRREAEVSVQSASE